MSENSPVLRPAVDVILRASAHGCHLVVALCSKRIYILQVVHDNGHVAAAIVLPRPVGREHPGSGASATARPLRDAAHARTRKKRRSCSGAYLRPSRQNQSGWPCNMRCRPRRCKCYSSRVKWYPVATRASLRARFTTSTPGFHIILGAVSGLWGHHAVGALAMTGALEVTQVDLSLESCEL